MPSSLPFIPADDYEHLDIASLKSWLWDAARQFSSNVAPSKFKDFILPLIFYKRLSDVFDDEVAPYIAKYGDAETAHAVIKADHEDALNSGRESILRFYIPAQYAWRELRMYPIDGTLGEFVNRAMYEVGRVNPDLQDVLNTTNYNERIGGQRHLDDDRLEALITALSRHRLGLHNAEPEVLGQAYEYLLRKFGEEGGGKAGGYYTPKEVSWLIAELLSPGPGSTIYDPACGSAGLLTTACLHYEQHHSDRHTQAPRLYGQEYNATMYAIAKMNLFLHGYTDACLAIGDTLRNPSFAFAEARLQCFDYVVADPMWNQPQYDEWVYTHDIYRRFIFGIPPRSSADWGWVQHMLASLNQHGRAAIVLDTGAVSRGSGGTTTNRERDIRRELIAADLIEGVILLPENLYSPFTPAASIILLLNRQKPANRRNQVLLVNASAYFQKEKHRYILTEEGVTSIAEVYRTWEARDQFSQVVTSDEVRASDFNLSPAKAIVVNTKVPPIFVSHSHADNAYCDAFVRTLRQQGANVWYDEHDLGAGHLSAEIDQQVATRPVLVAILSQAAFASKWVLRECTLALGAWEPTSERTIIPVAAQPIASDDFYRAMKGK